MCGSPSIENCRSNLARIKNLGEALATAQLALHAGVDWLEAGTHGFDERRGLAEQNGKGLSPLDQLRAVVAAVRVPVQAVGGLSAEQAVQTAKYGAPLVVLGAPLTIDSNALRAAGGDLESKLRLVCEKVPAYGDVATGSPGTKNGR